MLSKFESKFEVSSQRFAIAPKSPTRSSLCMWQTKMSVGETETQSVTKRRQHAVVIEFVRHELRKFEYGATDGNRLRQHHLCANVFHHRQVLVDDRRALVRRFRD